MVAETPAAPTPGAPVAGGQASTRGRRWRDCVAAPRRDAQGGGASVRDRGGRGAAATHGAEGGETPTRPPARASVHGERFLGGRRDVPAPSRVPDGHLRSLRRAAEKGSATEASAPATTSMRYIHEGLELSNAELDRAKREERAQVLRSGKLLLVLDLDHTLLNSARFSDLSQAQHNALGMVILARAAENGSFAGRDRHAGQEHSDGASGASEGESGGAGEVGTRTRTRTSRPPRRPIWPPRPRRPFRPGVLLPLKHLHCLQHLALFTKLRPHVHEFLAAASRLCQLYIYTMGDKNYAARDGEAPGPHGRALLRPRHLQQRQHERAHQGPRHRAGSGARGAHRGRHRSRLAEQRRQSDSRRPVPFSRRAPRDSASRVAR